MPLLLDERSAELEEWKGGAELRSQTDGWPRRRRRSLSGLLTATGTVVGRPRPAAGARTDGVRRRRPEARVRSSGPRAPGPAVRHADVTYTKAAINREQYLLAS